MEFTCVLSVGGSLAYYIITKHSDTAYTAILKESQGTRHDLPEKIELEKKGGTWQANPWHKEIVQAITHAIETA